LEDAVPVAEEIQQAEEVIEAFEEGKRGGEGAIQLGGKFIDYPVVERSRRFIELFRAISGKKES
jgi:citrate lyase subunit beta/citryl-CoA lyase